MDLSTLQKDYRDEDVLLVDRDGEPVVLGQKYTTFRGEEFSVLGSRAPHKAGSSGFVYGEGREVYVGVIGARWVRHVTVQRAQESLDPYGADNGELL